MTTTAFSLFVPFLQIESWKKGKTKSQGGCVCVSFCEGNERIYAHDLNAVLRRDRSSPGPETSRWAKPTAERKLPLALDELD